MIFTSPSPEVSSRSPKLLPQRMQLPLIYFKGYKYSREASAGRQKACVSGRGWGGIFMPLKRLMLLLNNYINLMSQVMTLC